MSIKKAGLIALLAIFVVTDLVAGALPNYAAGDVFICFRKADPTSGASLGGTNLIVDAGPVSSFTNLAPNTKITIAGVSGTQLSQVATNKVGWSAFACFDDSGTIFITEPRNSLNVQTSPNSCLTASAAGQTIGQMEQIPAGASNNISFSPLNTASGVLELDTYNAGAGAGALSYYNALTPTLDFNGTFNDYFEQYTPASFTFSGSPQRSDFYWMFPVPLHSITPAVFLGYFEFQTNGVMTYTAYPSATVVAPVIVSFTRNGTTNSITFSTGPTGTYTVRETNSVGLASARTNWPAIAATGGTGSNITVKDITASNNLFYVITAQ